MFVIALAPPYDLFKVASFAAGSLIVAGLALWRNLRFRQSAIKQLERPEFASWHGEKRYVLTESYIEEGQETGGMRMAWNSAELATTSKHHFVTLAARAFVLPRAQLSAGVERALVTRRPDRSVPFALAGEPSDFLVRLSFVPRESDSWAEYESFFEMSWRQLAVPLVGGGTIGTIAGLASGQRDDPLTLLCTIAVGAAFCLGVGYLLRWEGRRRYTRQLTMREPAEVRLEPGAVIINLDGATTRLAWEAVEKINLERTGIRIAGNSGSLFVPRHAFGSDSDFQDFARTAWSLHGSGPPARETPNPGG
jgi:hypothetical protein